MKPDLDRRGFLKGAVAGASLLMVPKALVTPGDKEFDQALPNGKVMHVVHTVVLYPTGNCALIPVVDGTRCAAINLAPSDSLSVYFDGAVL